MATAAVPRTTLGDPAAVRPRPPGRQRHGSRHPRRYEPVAPRRDGRRLPPARRLRIAHRQEQRLLLAQQEGPRRSLLPDHRHELHHAARHLALPTRQRHRLDDHRLQRRLPRHGALEAHQGRQGRRPQARLRGKVPRLLHEPLRPHRHLTPLLRRRAPRRRLLPLLPRHRDAQILVLLAHLVHRRLLVRLRLYRHDATDLHQLPPQVRRTPPVESHGLQSPQHLHRRLVCLRRQAAVPPPPRLLSRRYHLYRHALSAVHIYRRHVPNRRRRGRGEKKKTTTTINRKATPSRKIVRRWRRRRPKKSSSTS
mmetsp:Transcript_13030/g.42470  ORF Transcript_13030/g.42470 Transcript_13030/m.42470 type:complete len:309 (-) Transcript_13030:124-1050(-)